MSLLLSKCIDYCDVFYGTLFGKRMGYNIKVAARNTFISVIGGLAGSIIIFVTTLFAGRLLGPVEFGRVTLFLSFSQFFVLFLLFGNDITVLRQITLVSSEMDKKSNSTAAIFLFIVLALFLFLVTIIIYVYRASPSIFFLYFYSLIIAARQLMVGILSGFKKFKQIALIRIIDASLVLFSLLTLYYFVELHNYSVYILACIIGGFVAVILSLRSRIFSYIASLVTILDQIRLSLSIFLASLLGIIFFSLDKMIITYALGYNSLGIYGAYLAASAGVALQLSLIMSNVYMQTIASNIKSIKKIISWLDKFSLILFIPITGCMMLIVSCILLLFGTNYDYVLWYVFLAALYGSLVFIFNLYSRLVLIYSQRTIHSAMLYGNLVNILFICFYIFLIWISTVTIPIMLISLIIHSLLEIYICRRVIIHEARKETHEDGYENCYS